MNKKTLILIHGSKEHFERYRDFISFLEANNINVVTGNLATHGDANLTNHNFSLEEVVQSAMKIIKEAKDNYSEHKFYLFGHSFGSFIVKYIAYTNMEKFDGIILSGTNNPPRLLLNIGKLETSLWNKDKVSKFSEFSSYGMLDLKSKIKNKDKFWISSDPKVVQEFLDSPLCGKPFSKKALNAMYELILVSNNPKTLQTFNYKNTPQLIIYGKNDPVTNFGKDIKKMVKNQQKAGLATPQIMEYQNSRHEVLFDVEKEKVYNDILFFINEN